MRMRNLVLVLAASLVGLLLVEGVLRVAGYSRPPFYRYSATLGAEHRPGTEGWYEKEDLIRIRINSDGVRGPELSREKPADVFRVAVLGDSFAEGFQVTFDERFSHVAETALNRCNPLGKRVEVINFGVSGYGTGRELLMYRQKAALYQPDVVLLLFTPVNDLRNNLKAFTPNALVPYFELRDGELVLDDSFKRDPVFIRKLKWSNLRNDIVDRVRVLQVLQDFYVRTRLERWLAAEEQEAEAAGDGRSLAYDPPLKPLEQEAWAVTEALIAELQAETAAAGSDFWLSVVEVSAPVLSDPAVREAKRKVFGVRRLTYVEDRLQGFAASHGIGFISLLEPLRRHAEATGVELDYFEHLGGRGGHWNREAHRVAGETIAAALCKALRGRAGTAPAALAPGAPDGAPDGAAGDERAPQPKG